MKVYIVTVTIRYPNTYSYSEPSFSLERVFAKKEDAEMYIEHRKKDFDEDDDVSFDIEEETVIQNFSEFFQNLT